MAAFAAAAGAVVLTEFIVVGLLPAISSNFGIALPHAGWLVSAFALSAAVLGPVLTLAMGRTTPRIGLALALTVYGGTGVIAPLVESFEVLLAARILQGAILTYFISTASKAAMDLSAPDRSARAVGQVNVGTILGAMSATPLGVWGADVLGWQGIYLGLGGAALLLVLPLLAIVPGRLTPSEPALARPVAILKSGTFLVHLMLSFLVFSAMFVPYSFVTAILLQALEVSAGSVALVLTVIGAAGLVGNALASRAADRDADCATACALAALSLSGVGLGVLGWHAVSDFLVLVIWGAAHSAAFVACQVRVMVQAPQAAAFAGSLNIAVCNVGIGTGALVGGWVLNATDIMWLGPAMTAIAMPALVLGVFLMRIRR